MPNFSPPLDSFAQSEYHKRRIPLIDMNMGGDAMNRRSVHQDELLSRHMPVVCLLSVCFLLGAVIGSFFAADLPESSSGYVASYVQRISGATGIELFKSSFWPSFILLALVFFSGFGRLSMLVIPAVFLVRGFTMSLAITAFVSVYGLKGYIPALLTEFLSSFVITACLFVLSLFSFSLSASWSRRVEKHVPIPRLALDASYYTMAAVCLTGILLASLLYAYLLPPLARAVLLIIIG